MGYDGKCICRVSLNKLYTLNTLNTLRTLNTLNTLYTLYTLIAYISIFIPIYSYSFSYFIPDFSITRMLGEFCG